MKLSDRYAVRTQLGEGTFGRVLECEELKTGAAVAVKVRHPFVHLICPLYCALYCSLY